MLDAAIIITVAIISINVKALLFIELLHALKVNIMPQQSSAISRNNNRRRRREYFIWRLISDPIYY